MNVSLTAVPLEVSGSISQLNHAVNNGCFIRYNIVYIYVILELTGVDKFQTHQDLFVIPNEYRLRGAAQSYGIACLYDYSAGSNGYRPVATIHCEIIASTGVIAFPYGVPVSDLNVNRVAIVGSYATRPL